METTGPAAHSPETPTPTETALRALSEGLWVVKLDLYPDWTGPRIVGTSIPVTALAVNKAVMGEDLLAYAVKDAYRQITRLALQRAEQAGGWEEALRLLVQACRQPDGDWQWSIGQHELGGWYAEAHRNIGEQIHRTGVSLSDAILEVVARLKVSYQ